MNSIYVTLMLSLCAVATQAQYATKDPANGKYGFIDKTGKEIIPSKFEKISSFSEGLAAFKLNGEWGYINKKGTLVVPAIYAGCEAFKYGKTSVYNTEGKEMIIDKTGKKM